MVGITLRAFLWSFWKVENFMRNIKLETLGQSSMLVNWDNVNMVKEVTSSFGEKYREIFFANGSTVATKITMEELESMLAASRTQSGKV